MPVPFDKAIFDETFQYRYLLTRNWASDHGRACFIMFNPSTADADNDDPTIRSCVRIARQFLGAITVVNLFAFRATDCRQLLIAADPVGWENDDYIRRAVKDCSPVIAAWGAHAEETSFRCRAAAVEEMLLESGVNVSCLGTTKGGSPRHPLFIPSDAELKPYDLNGLNRAQRLNGLNALNF